MLKPLRGYVLIEPIKEEEKTAVGVFLPESAKDKPMKGKVIAVGKNNIPEGMRVPITSIAEYRFLYCPVKEDDFVYFKKWGNEEVKEDGKEYVFVRFEDLLGVEYGKSN